MLKTHTRHPLWFNINSWDTSIFLRCSRLTIERLMKLTTNEFILQACPYLSFAENPPVSSSHSSQPCSSAMCSMWPSNVHQSIAGIIHGTWPVPQVGRAANRRYSGIQLFWTSYEKMHHSYRPGGALGCILEPRRPPQCRISFCANVTTIYVLLQQKICRRVVLSHAI